MLDMYYHCCIEYFPSRTCTHQCCFLLSCLVVLALWRVLTWPMTLYLLSCAVTLKFTVNNVKKYGKVLCHVFMRLLLSFCLCKHYLRTLWWTLFCQLIKFIKYLLYYVSFIVHWTSIYNANIIMGNAWISMYIWWFPVLVVYVTCNNHLSVVLVTWSPYQQCWMLNEYSVAMPSVVLEISHIGGQGELLLSVYFGLILVA